MLHLTQVWRLFYSILTFEISLKLENSCTYFPCVRTSPSIDLKARCHNVPMCYAMIYALSLALLPMRCIAGKVILAYRVAYTKWNLLTCCFLIILGYLGAHPQENWKSPPSKSPTSLCIVLCTAFITVKWEGKRPASDHRMHKTINSFVMVFPSAYIAAGGEPIV